MSHFDISHPRLKTFEALFTDGDRVKRFIWTCLRGTEYENASDRFELFSETLYEARWKQVAKFSKALLKIIPVLAKTRDARKYVSGVDNNNEAFKELRKMEEKDSDRGDRSFAPSDLSAVLKDNMFRIF